MTRPAEVHVDGRPSSRVSSARAMMQSPPIYNYEHAFSVGGVTLCPENLAETESWIAMLNGR